MVDSEVEDTSSTRSFDTALGILTYQQVSDVIAEPLSVVMEEIALNGFDGHSFDAHLMRLFHRRILSDVLPEIAGEWRTCAVRVGSHYPPEYRQVPRMIWELVDNLSAKMAYARDDLDMQVELLAYFEADFLHIHPFKDFNGRTVRMLLSELMRRLDFPVVPIYTADRESDEFRDYVGALRAFDSDRWVQPMTDFWNKYRLSKI